MRFVLVSSALVALLALTGGAPAASGPCPEQMASIDGEFCIDRWEASLVDASGTEHFPYALVKDEQLRARSAPDAVPHGHVSAEQASAACQGAGKRLCTRKEWLKACRGRTETRYPYGDKHRPGYCNDDGVSPLGVLHGKSLGGLDYRAMNDPRLNQLPGTVARTGSYARCVNEYGVHDMVGNLHEWTAEASGAFRGGYYLDTSLLGEGCNYVADGHDRNYRDYSTGFRCCADAAR